MMTGTGNDAICLMVRPGMWPDITQWLKSMGFQTRLMDGSMSAMGYDVYVMARIDDADRVKRLRENAEYMRQLAAEALDPKHAEIRLESAQMYERDAAAMQLRLDMLSAVGKEGTKCDECKLTGMHKMDCSRRPEHWQAASPASVKAWQND